MPSLTYLGFRPGCFCYRRTEIGIVGVGMSGAAVRSGVGSASRPEAGDKRISHAGRTVEV